MKRSAIEDSNRDAAGPRRSKRLAQVAAKKLISNNSNANNNVPSVVSLSSKEETPQKLHVFKNPFPQDMIRAVEDTLIRTTDAIELQCCWQSPYIMDRPPPNPATIHELKQTQAMFYILKFALKDDTFLAHTDATRIRQDELVRLLSTQEWQQHLQLNPFGYIGTFVETLVIRGDMVPPRSISFLLDDDETQEKDCLSSATEIQQYKQQLVEKGEACLDSLSSLDFVVSMFLNHDMEKKNRVVLLLSVCKGIVRVWIHVLESSQWDASKSRVQEQLDNVATALDFCKRLTHNVQAIDVKTLLLKLVLYFSFAMDSPCETCTREERRQLKELAKVLRC